jgi:hypothetical protein
VIGMTTTQTLKVRCQGWGHCLQVAGTANRGTIDFFIVFLSLIKYVE